MSGSKVRGSAMHYRRFSELWFTGLWTSEHYDANCVIFLGKLNPDGCCNKTMYRSRYVIPGPAVCLFPTFAWMWASHRAMKQMHFMQSVHTLSVSIMNATGSGPQ